jgi:hypothetical protein
MAWTISTGTLTGQVGSLLTVLDAALVAAGWTIAFTGTNKRVYRNGSGAMARRYVRVDDSGSGTGGAKEALIRGYNAMTTVDAGTNDFPTTVQLSAGMVICKSQTADATTRSYILAADDRTFILFIKTGHTSYTDHWGTTYVGEFYSFVPNDTNAFIIAGRQTQNSSSFTSELALYAVQAVAFNATFTPSALFIGGSHNGAVGSVACNPATDSFAFYWYTGSFTSGTDGIGGWLSNPNPADGAIVLSPLYLITGSTATTAVLRGRYRGLYIPCHRVTEFAHGDAVTGAGELAARSFQIVKHVTAFTGGGSGFASGLAALETTAPATSE